MLTPLTFGVNEDVIAVLFSSHSATVPLLLRHKMSVRASPLKSPICTTCQSCPGETALPPAVTAPLPMMLVPFISQTTSELVALSRHRRSVLPSPLKSPAPATLQLKPGATAETPLVVSPLLAIF